MLIWILLLIWFVAAALFVPCWWFFIKWGRRGGDDPYLQWLDDNEQMRWISNWHREKERKKQDKKQKRCCRLGSNQ